MDPELLAAVNLLARCMSAPQIRALAEELEALETRTGGTRARGVGENEQGSVVLVVKGGRVRFIEARRSRDVGRLDAEVPTRVGRV